MLSFLLSRALRLRLVGFSETELTFARRLIVVWPIRPRIHFDLLKWRCLNGINLPSLHRNRNSTCVLGSTSGRLPVMATIVIPATLLSVFGWDSIGVWGIHPAIRPTLSILGAVRSWPDLDWPLRQRVRGLS